MNQNTEDLTGRRFGKLTVVARAHRHRGKQYWECLCDCGIHSFTQSWCLLRANTRSCGCLRKARAINLVGQRFNRLVVLERDTHIAAKVWTWRCQCDCGNITLARTQGLRNGHKQSCGCLHRELATAQAMTFQRPLVPNHTHGHASQGHQSRTYRSWKGAKTRCFNLNEVSWFNYGGRGITMCDAWKDDFSLFLADMGEAPPGMTLDRINNNGNYEPGNCRWATPATQALNQRQRRTFKPHSYWAPEEHIEALCL